MRITILPKPLGVCNGAKPVLSLKKVLLTFTSVLFLCCTVIAQNRNITGTVNDNNGQPIPGASVIVKGSKVGTTTNSEGQFSLTIPASARTLQVSSLNMTSQEVAISG